MGEGMNHAGQGTGSMLWIGAPCAHCRREDFLPLECGGCHKSFCTAHFAQDTHHCPHRQQSDVRVPICPLCHEPPHGWKRNASAAEVQRIMEAHWSASAGDQRSCAALVPRTSSQSLCAYASCQRALKLAIRCPHCNVVLLGSSSSYSARMPSEARRACIRARLETGETSQLASH